jgi:glycosyltransferase involved in cell wall biosynthesis
VGTAISTLKFTQGMQAMLVSVYIPTRNRVGLLAKAIDSVFAQTYEDIELVVVNDASHDGTEEYLCRRAQGEPRLTHVSNSGPRGASASRNIAILKSKGTFVTGLDDDDQFLPERIAAFIDYWDLLTLRGIRPSCLYSQEKWTSHGVPYAVTKKRGSVSADDLFETNFIGGQIFAPRSHYIDVGLFDEQLPAWQDLEMFMRLLSRFGDAHLLDMVTYLFDQSPRTDRISTQVTKIRAAAEIVMKKHAAESPRKSRQLFLQMFSEYYGIRPNISDWARLCRWGTSPGRIYELLRATVRRRQVA